MTPANTLLGKTLRQALGFGLVAAFAALPPDVEACSRIVDHLAGALAQDGSVVYALRDGGDAHPGLLRLAHFTATGIATGDLYVDLGVVDGHIQVRGIDGAGNVWLAVRCYSYLESELCNRLVLVTPTGEVAHTLPLAETAWPRFDPARGQFINSDFSDGRLSVLRYGTGEEKPLMSFSRPEGIELRDFEPSSWAVDRDGEAVVVIEKGLAVTFLRYAASGELRISTHFPRARSGRAFDDSETVRLGHIGAMVLAEDGTLFASQFAMAPDCEIYQPPSVAILDAAGNLVAVAPTDDTIGMMRALDHELVVLQDDGRVIRLAHDGTRLESWTPALGHWRQPQGPIEERRERAARAGPADGPAVWLEVYAAADFEKRTLIDGWLVEVGPQALDDTPDRKWQDLAARLCARHPGTAPTEALRRFGRSQGLNKARWLESLVSCFDQPPSEAYAYALEIVDRDDTYTDAAEKALRAWGYSRETLDALWRTATAAEPDPKAGQSLLRAFDQLAEDFDDRLRRGPQAARLIVRQLLLEMVAGAESFFWVDGLSPGADDEPPAQRWARLAPAAREWVESRDRLVAATGRLVLLGHREAPVEAAWPALIADAEQDPSLVPWLVYTVGKVVEEDGPQALPDAALEKLVAWALDAPARTGIATRASWNDMGDPYYWLFELEGEIVLDRLYERGLEASASARVRQRLLWRLYNQPWALGQARLERFLAEPWLAQRSHFSTTMSFLARLNQLVDDLEVPLRQKVRDRFRQLVLDAADRRRLVINFQPQDDGDRLLRQALEVDDVATLVERTPNGVRTWLWLIAAFGAWPEIEAEVNALLSDPGYAVAAAVALAPHRHPEALEVLMRLGLHGRQVPASAFAPYGAAARQRLTPLVFHEDWAVRQAARRVLAAVSPDSSTLAKLAAEAAEELAQDKLPELPVAMMLLDSDPGLMPQLITQLQTRRKAGGYLDEYGSDLDFARAVARWAQGNPLRQRTLRDLWGHLNNLVSPPALAWRAAINTES